MLYNKKISVCLAALLMVCTLCNLTACQYSNQEAPAQEATVATATNDDADISEEAGVDIAFVKDTYDSKEAKRLIVYAEELPESLSLVDEKGNLAMKLKIEPYGMAEGKILGHSEFSSLKESGVYRVYVDSKDKEAIAEFTIENDFYRKRIKELALESFQEASDYSLYVIAESYELFPDAFGDDWGLAESGNGIPDILDLMENYIQNHDDDKDCYFFATAAKYSLMMEKYDTHKAANAKNLVNNALDAGVDTDSNGEGLTVLNSEAFRLTDSKNEKQLVEAGLNDSFNESDKSIDDLWKYLAYLNSSADVDIELAGKFMKEIIQDSEETLNIYKEEYPFFYSNSKKAENVLEDMVRLSITNQILPAYEYYKVINRQTDFIRGLNNEKQALDLNNSKNKAYSILIFSHLATIEDSVNDLYAQEN